MRIVGGGQVVELKREDEWHHVADSHEMWQESVVLCWWDLKNQVGGFHRIGHQPFHPQGPQVHLSNNFFAADCVYKRCDILSLRPQDKFPKGFGCGDDSCTYEFSDHAIWTFNQPEVQGQLHVHDYHPPVDIYPKSGQVAEQLTAGHLEVGGSVSGSIRLNGIDYEVDGMAFRDHGWGKRYWEVLAAHRWIVGTFGPDLIIVAASIMGTNDHIDRFGCVIRGDELTYSSKVDILAYMEQDAVTHRGGRLSMELTTGEVMVIELEPLQKGVVSWIAETTPFVNTMCRMMLDGRTGVGIFEASNNATRGRHYPSVAVNGFATNGLHQLSAAKES